MIENVSLPKIVDLIESGQFKLDDNFHNSINCSLH